MTLENLLAVQRLQRFEASRDSVAKLLAAAERNLADAGLDALSTENRFDAAYKTIMQCAMIGLWANGYRTPTSQPGHHQTTLQALPKSLGVPSDTVVVLDALRKQRNLSDYDGAPISRAALGDCLRYAADLLTHTRGWLRGHRPDLLPPDEIT